MHVPSGMVARKGPPQGPGLTSIPYQLARLDYFPALFYDFRTRHFKPDEPANQPAPSVTAFLTAPIQPLVQQLARQIVVLIQALAITDDALVIPVASQLGLERVH